MTLPINRLPQNKDFLLCYGQLWWQMFEALEEDGTPIVWDPDLDEVTLHVVQTLEDGQPAFQATTTPDDGHYTDITTDGEIWVSWNPVNVPQGRYRYALFQDHTGVEVGVPPIRRIHAVGEIVVERTAADVLPPQPV